MRMKVSIILNNSVICELRREIEVLCLIWPYKEFSTQKKTNTFRVSHFGVMTIFQLIFLWKPKVDFKCQLCFQFLDVGFPVMCALCHNWLLHCFYAVSLVSNLFQVLFQIVKCKWTDCNQFCIDLLLFQTWENLIIITANPYSGNPLFTRIIFVWSTICQMHFFFNWQIAVTPWKLQTI